MSDTYFDALNLMINRFLEYKPGSITLENITRLCQAMGLESFVDQVNSNISRLSIASKIIVIDIDYETTDGRVTDVKLVLASNFDRFDYFNGEENILYRSLTNYSELHEFHYNLRFLTLLDAYSNIEIESNISQFDLFEYYSVLPRYVQQYLNDNGVKLKVRTNLNDRFGIYLVDEEGTAVAKLIFGPTLDPAQRYYEYKYSSKTKEWFNESPESYASGVTLLVELLGKEKTYFARDCIPLEQLQTSHENDMDPESPEPFAFKANNRRIHLSNDFTIDLYPVSSLQLFNDNVSLLFDILKWYNWWHKVLHPISEILLEGENEMQGGSSLPQVQPPSSASHCRRPSVKGHRRPSVNDPSVLKDENLAQFTLNDILNSSTIEEDDEMVDDEAVDLFVNEDYVYLGMSDRCSYYDDSEEEWVNFITKLKQLT
ncbi:HBL133Wp [Eremothecium sinecaudum]|uniref:Mediator of RNA polymerase II transcription subunit 1 n=1 Tax=Eremothecium sinecaudum TaxID=45286 RepID=A0A120K0W7_9SACH|nr:HBL133Wp [Eremothecium sinecaudum]AMD18769.1 HBL133Wp [Eremothecium sinecaudum]